MTLLAHPDAPPAISDRRRNTPDRVLFITTLALSMLGLLMIYSATRVGLERDNLPASFSMERQMIFVAAGLILFVGLSFVDYRELGQLAHVIYVRDDCAARPGVLVSGDQRAPSGGSTSVTFSCSHRSSPRRHVSSPWRRFWDGHR